MEKSIRLRKNREYTVVYKKGRRYWNHQFTMVVKKNNGPGTRVGFSVNKKYGNAVERNRIKRQLREIIRLHYDTMKKGYDIILIPKKNTKELDYHQLEKSVKHLFHLGFRPKKKVKK
ncbi:MAG: ribonuclease P protein component [Gallicola sp.]|uniref:ribonuclease P protein component n=1 Tax=Gallicola sp. Sow4_E12 TaxID=3438785 RepID=UPI0017C5B896|nr:ribonuclease P protein component [Gallicola sp.]